MAMPGYFIEVTFTDGSVVTTYATTINEWYYFYSDKRYRFTRGTGTDVILQQYQPIGTNMAWYDINIIQSVDVQQFDPSTSGGGAMPDDVYTKEEVNQLIDNAVNQIMEDINNIVNEAVQSALGDNYYNKQECDDRFVHVTGDTMTGQLVINYGNSKAYYGSGGFDTYTDNSLRLRIYDDGNGGSVACYQADGTNVTIRPTNISGFVSSAGAYKTITFASSGIHLNDTIIVPENSSFLVSGRCRYAGTYINSYYTNSFAIEFNDQTYIRLINNNNSGALACYDKAGNNTWMETTQLSAWINGGTVQRKIVFGQDAYSFDTTIQVPSGQSFLISNGCRYGDKYINGYGNNFGIKLSDSDACYFNKGTISLYGNSSAFGKMIMTLNANDGYMTTNKGNLLIYGANNTGLGNTGQLFFHNDNRNVELDAIIDFATTDQYYTVNMLDALNIVINAMQDVLGTVFTAKIEPHAFTGAGGGTTRGGGVGKGY